MGDDITQPASGRFVLRVAPALHEELRGRAAARGVSLNELCAQALASEGAISDPELARAIRGIRKFVGSSLVGVVAYGSWARGDDTPSSDVDLLAVVESDVPLTRELYRRIDSEDLCWAGRPISVHFARLREEWEPVTGTWAEVATDGLVLLDPTLRLGRALGSIRRRILEGEIERRTVHGQPYWLRAGA